MADDTLDPGLHQIAEQYLNRPLESQEALLLLALQQARQQATSQGQAGAASSVRSILDAIEASSSQARQLQEKEEQAILKLLEGSQTLADLRPSSLQPGRAELQPSSPLALTQIAEHLSNLTRQEVEKCFQQTYDPLAEQLHVFTQQMNKLVTLPASATTPPTVARDR